MILFLISLSLPSCSSTDFMFQEHEHSISMVLGVNRRLSLNSIIPATSSLLPAHNPAIQSPAAGAEEGNYSPFSGFFPNWWVAFEEINCAEPDSQGPAPQSRGLKQERVGYRNKYFVVSSSSLDECPGR